MYAKKVIPVQFSAIASGDGYWGLEQGIRVDFDLVECIVNGYRHSDGSVELMGELRFGHEHNANDIQALCYTDKGVENSVRTFVERNAFLNSLFSHVSGSEQGMQGDKFLSCDMNIKNGVTFKQLEELGFTVDYKE